MMPMSCRCGECGITFISQEDDIFVEFDYKDQQIRYICRNKECGHTNVFDFGGWKKQQKHSPLPVPIMG